MFQNLCELLKKGGFTLPSKVKIACFYPILAISWKLFSIRIPLRVHLISGEKFIVPDLVSIQTISNIHEPWMEKYFKPNGGVFLDIGAHVGKYTIKWARRTKLTIAVEPDQINSECLKQNCSLNGLHEKVICCKICLSNKEDFKNFYMPAVSYGGSLKRGMYGEIKKEIKTKICTKRLDDLVCELNLDSVDWVKIDVEGAEAEVIEGGLKTILKFRPKMVVEVCGNNSLEKIKKMLVGYRLIPIEESYIPHKITRWVNYFIAVQKVETQPI